MPTPSTLHLFSQTACRLPYKTAIEHAVRRVTYRDLEQVSNRIAKHLMAANVPKGIGVGILVEDLPQVIASIIGVMKAGCVIVPLDPHLPPQRLREMISLTAPMWLLVESDAPATLAKLLTIGDCGGARLLCLNRAGNGNSAPRSVTYLADEPGCSEAELVARTASITPDDPCSIFFTSGSTGQPKAIVGCVGGVDHFMSWEIDTLEIDESARVSQLALPSFDGILKDIFVPLCTGGTLCIPESRDTVLDSRSLVAWLADERISILHTAPSVFRLIVNDESGRRDFPALKYIFLAGEPIPIPDLVKWFGWHGDWIKIANIYGPTETTITKLFHFIQRSDVNRRSVPIGKPMRGTAALIIDDEGEVCPPGVIGEIYIRTPFRLPGYYQRPDLTKESFVQDLFGTSAHERVYRTGDLGRILPDGNFEFIGRRDNQVKIRGVRVELAEVENFLRAHASVKDAVVIAREDSGGTKYLCAYIVAQCPVKPGELRAHMQGLLPDYMTPSRFVFLNAMPLTPNRKIDRRALPGPEKARAGMKEDREPPRNALELKLSLIWAEVLAISDVGIHDNFFELGGHSLLATRVLSRVRGEFGVDVPLRRIFQTPTVAGLAGAVESALANDAAAEPPAVRVLPRDVPAPLSFSQQRIWFLDQLEPGNPFFNVPAAARLSGALCIDALRRALTEILQRHEALRTSFRLVEGQPAQVVEVAEAFVLPVLDISDIPEGEREAEVQRLAIDEAQQPFDLRCGQLLRARLYRLSNNEHVLLIIVHHIVFDGWSFGVFIKELAVLYQAFSTGRAARLPALPIQYVDFAAWQHEWVGGAVLQKQLAYWKRQLDGAALLELPIDRSRTPAQTRRGGRHSFTLPAELTEALRALSRREQSTLFMTLLTAFQALMARYTGQDDISVGTLVAGRQNTEFEGLIGFFVNALVMRTDVAGDPAFNQLLRRVRKVCLDAFANQDVPFEKLVESLRPRRSLSHSPLFEVLFVLLNAPAETVDLPGLAVTPMDVHNGTAKYDLSLFVLESNGGADCWFEYDADLFDRSTIQRMSEHFTALLRGVAADPETRVSLLPLLVETERRRLTEGISRTALTYADNLCFHQLFAEQAERTPEAVAAADAERSLTYAEVNRRTNRLATALIAHGVGEESVVPLLFERGLDLLIMILAVLKAGGNYLPLDPHHPEARRAQVLGQSGSALVVAQSKFLPGLLSGIANLPLETRPGVVAAEYLFDQGNGEAPLAGGSPANKAYVIFTSGSTGIPKGVMIEHRGVLNHLYAKISDLGLTRDDVVAQNASQCFDISVWQLLAPLLVGARVEIFDDRLTNDVLRFLEEVERRGVTVLEVVPSFLRVMLNEIERPHALVHRLTRLRWLLSTGEALPVELCRQWLEMYPRIPMVNAFGPTECSDDVCHYFARYPPSADMLRVPIGKPIAGTQLYVLDRYMNPVPACIPGELYVGGRGVGRGYAGDPASTAEVFLPDPFSAMPGSRLYKTGDLVRLLADGEIEFLGRIDEQVKVRGFRIELGEIENALEQHADVSAGAAIVYERPAGDKRIVAYVVPRRDGAQLTEELRWLLKERLPDYMIPAAIFALDELPLTTTGKINRKALAAMAEGALASAGRPFVTPSTPSEVTLADLCAEVLGLDRLSIQDDFFELGGHSLLAAQLISRVRELFKMDLPLKLLFEATTVEKLARAIDSLQAEREAQRRQIALALELVEGMTEDEATELLKERDSISMKG